MRTDGDSKIQLIRRTDSGLIGVGLRSLIGVRPDINIKILNTYVTPRLTFALEALILHWHDTN